MARSTRSHGVTEAFGSLKDFEVRDGMFRHDGGDAIVFTVAPTKVLSFAKGYFAQTRFRFTS